MCDFKPGDEVVCVTLATPLGNTATGIVVGKVYTVLRVEPTFYSDGTVDEDDPVVQLVDAVWPCKHHRGGYDPSLFRKVQKRSSDLSIEAFLTIKPGFEEPRRQPTKTPSFTES